MSHTGKEEWYEARAEFVSEHGRQPHDIMTDKQGEYILSKANEVDEGEPEFIGYKKIYLPDNLQSGFVYDEKQD